MEYFIARIYSSDSVIVGIPGVSYDHLYNIEQYKVSESVGKKMDENRNKMVPALRKDKVVPMLWMLLKFQLRKGMKGVRLSIKDIYNNEDNKDETSLELQYYPVQSVHDLAGPFVTWWASWNIVCFDATDGDSDRKRGAPDLRKKRSKAAQQAAQYANIYGIGGDGDDDVTMLGGNTLAPGSS